MVLRCLSSKGIMLRLCDDSRIQLVTCHCHVPTLQCLMTYTVCYGRYDIFIDMLLYVTCHTRVAHVTCQWLCHINASVDSGSASLTCSLMVCA